MRNHFLIIVFAVAAIFLIACADKPATPPAATKPAGFAELPVTMTVRQRSTTAVPGSDGRLLVTIDDITRNQVMASLATKDGTLLLPSRSMKAGDTVEFRFAETAYGLKLEHLDNALVGDDFATFVISAAGEAMGEKAKIESLIRAVGELEGATFIRNGSEHSAAEAAEHLKSKWQAKSGEITTAQQFIDEIASKSTASDQPYQIKLQDGRVMNSREFFTERLRDLEAGR